MFRPFNSRAGFREFGDAGDSAPALDLAQRFPRLVGLDGSAAASLAAQKVAVVGLGSVGRRIAMHVARLGPKQLWLVDSGSYDHRANLLTQEIVAADLGQAKAVSTGRACKSISPATEVLAYEGQFQDLDPVKFAAADIVFLASDNLAAEIDVSHCCRLLALPVIQASVHGETLVAQVRFVENHQPKGPCLICPYGSEEYRHLNHESLFSCDGNGNGQRAQISSSPTNSTSFLCSLASDFSLTQWMRYVLDLGGDVADTMLHYCGYTHRLHQSPLVSNKHCRSTHAILEQRELPSPVGEFTVADLVRRAGFAEEALESAALTLGEKTFVESAICDCGPRIVSRFVSSGVSLGVCGGCGAGIEPQPYYTFRPTPMVELDRKRTLLELDAGDAPWAVLHADGRGVLLRAAGHTGADDSKTVREQVHGV
ncbi:MAG: ThiF family adenylyltransferase [Pirellulales bacterium]